MVATVTVVLPIFALILAGFLCRRLAVLGPGAAGEINRFVVYLALPALLFDVTAHAGWEQLYQPRFVAAFGLGCAISFTLTVALRLRKRQPLADASIDGLNAAYANTGYIGFPLCLIAFGRESLAAVTIASLITVCVLFAAAIALIESALAGEHRPGPRLAPMAGKIGRSLIRNPLLVAPVLGALFAASGFAIPAGALTFLRLLGNAASPCALVALGLFLAERRPGAAADRGVSMLLVALKLGVQPAITWVLAYRVFAMPAALANTAVLLAALPTGTGPFMLAEFYRREAVITASAILVSTLLSMGTLSLLLWLAGHGGI